MADSSLCKLVFVTLSWDATITLSFLELAEEDCLGHVYIFDSCDVASPRQLHLKHLGSMMGRLALLRTSSIDT